MCWNYRIVQKPSTDFVDETMIKAGLYDESYEIHEVFYDKNGEMESMTEQSVSFYAGTVKGLAIMMLEALEKPVIVWDEKLKKPVELLLKKRLARGILYRDETQ